MKSMSVIFLNKFEKYFIFQFVIQIFEFENDLIFFLCQTIYLLAILFSFQNYQKSNISCYIF